MKDLIIEAYKDLHNKPFEFRNAYLSGLIAGLGVQLALVLETNTRYFDGSLTHALKLNSRSSARMALSDLGGEWERVLSPGLLIGWNYSKSDESRTYFNQMGVGAIYVSQFVLELQKESGYTDKEALEIAERYIRVVIENLNTLF